MVVDHPNAEGGSYGETYRCGWDTWPAKVGMERPVRFHDLRHTCASLLVSGAWGRALPLEQVRAWLRHSSINVTQRYAHLRPEALQGAQKALAEHWTSGQAEAEAKGAAGTKTGAKALILNIRPKPQGGEI